jgi:hypothetical protein
MNRFAQSAAALILLSLTSVAVAEVAVIINPGTTETPSRSDVVNIFLGKDRSLKGLDQRGWNPTKEVFYAAMTSKNETQLKSYWSGLVFTGKGQPMTSVADDAAVIAKVAAEAEVIGYVDSTAVNDSVRVLFILP